MLSTGSMIKLGKVYGNLMVDVKPSNLKLIDRCVSIVQNATGVSRDEAKEVLDQCDYRPKTAIVMIEIMWMSRQQSRHYSRLADMCLRQSQLPEHNRKG